MTNRENVLKAMKEEYLRNILFFEHEVPKLAEILKKNLDSDTGIFQNNDHDGVIKILERYFFNLKNSYEAYSVLVNTPVTSVSVSALLDPYENPPGKIKKTEYINNTNSVLLNESQKFQDSCDF